MTTKTETIEGTVAEYVTAVIGGQLFGLPISRVQDVFMPERLTRVPLSSARSPVLNLRGRIVTVVDMRARLGLPRTTTASRRWRSASICAAVLWPPDRPDRRVLRPTITAARKPRQPRSPHGLAGGVHRLDGQLMVVLDVDRVLEIVPDLMAACRPTWNENIPLGIVQVEA